MALSKEEEQSSMRPIHFQISMNPSFERRLMSGFPGGKDFLIPLEIGKSSQSLRRADEGD